MVEVSSFGSLATPDVVGRREVARVVLRSSVLRVATISFGASLHTVEAPDRDGHLDHVGLALDDLAGYEDRERNPYLGATCGRYANRIVGASFVLDGRRHQLPANDGPHHLHGGPDGFSRRVWQVGEVATTVDGGRVTFALRSDAGDAGYPGAVDATATYALDGDRLRITYEAVADAPTVINLCNHAYWNLGGRGRWGVERSIGDHTLRVLADRVLPAGADAAPTGPLRPVDGPLDLRSPTRIDDLLERHGGVDQSYALAQDRDDDDDGAAWVVRAAELGHEPSGRTLTVATDQPAVHLYTGNHLGSPFAPQSALCLEAQRFPDAPNRPDLPSGVLRPGSRYRSTTELTFGVR
jgi:aldose 1-epimerase